MTYQDKEVRKLTWMKQEFINDCKRMLKLIEKQEEKVRHKTERK